MTCAMCAYDVWELVYSVLMCVWVLVYISVCGCLCTYVCVGASVAYV